MQLYTSKNGTNPMRVRLYLAEKDLKLPEIDLDLLAGDQTRPEYLLLNSLGTVPSLELDDGVVITESIAICRYLEELHATPPLFGANHLERAIVEMWNRRVELEIYANAAWAVKHSHPFFNKTIKQIPAFAAEQCDKTAEKLQWLDSEMADGRPFIAGDNYSVADITGYVALYKLLPALNMTVSPELTHLSAWVTRVGKRPAVATLFV